MCFYAIYQNGSGKRLCDKINYSKLEAFHFHFGVEKARQKNDGYIRFFSFRQLSASNPSISGISISNRIKSGVVFSKNLNIFAADGRVITRYWSCNAFSAKDKLVLLSSTTKIVFFIKIPLWGKLPISRRPIWPLIYPRNNSFLGVR